eukprot:6771695-Pyramimonas_sp.AAC.1
MTKRRADSRTPSPAGTPSSVFLQSTYAGTSCVVQSMRRQAAWCNPCGAAWVVQYMWPNLRGAKQRNA